ncbi:hypothetical protein PPTG_11930 [Phytophthora nicotianae INRA-310]|uniref:HTH CENPB-type domain-containing protein n=1 Tax=Phytophthora nicotianae (strain INRA-310) TaxID=761204 RepID=W2QBF7_PHYN3|nr:hypothetical protein PPTG_11930 [Phytophthora nicotianae INRA-310]ETN09600.1 hypothetical protein PPTG_11930 [Phytophthora nicotianae INRA-310]
MSDSVDTLQDLTSSDVTSDALALNVTELPPPPPRTNVPSGTKRKRVVLSIHDKQQVLQRLESGEQPIAIARAFGISRQQVSDIKKNKERIVAFCIDAKHMSTLKRKTLKATSEYHPGVEQELYRWLIRQRKLGRAVTTESLATKTTDLFMQYSPDDSHMSLKATTNWLRHFKKAHGIKSLTEEELQQLPEQFVPAMDMTRPGDVAAAYSQASATEATISTSSMTPTGNYFSSITSATHTTVAQPVNVLSGTTPTMPVPPAPSTAVPMAHIPASMDVNAYMHIMNTQAVGAPADSLQATVNTAQQLSVQLARFERDMAIKLDYLDERVAKLCYLVLPTRLG